MVKNKLIRMPLRVEQVFWVWKNNSETNEGKLTKGI